MKKISLITCVVLFNFFAKAQQEVLLRGQLLSEDSTHIEMVNIINITHKSGTMTNGDGVFVMPVFKGDTLLFSAIQFQNKTLIISDEILINPYVNVVLEIDNIALNAIVLTNRFSMLDTNKTGGDIDLNLPFNTTPIVRPYSQRRLDYLQGGIISSIVNGLNGKTKNMKKVLALEKENELLEQVKLIFNMELYRSLGVPESEIYLFLEIHFKEAKYRGLLKEGNQFELIHFLKEKAAEFVHSRELMKDTSLLSK